MLVVLYIILFKHMNTSKVLRFFILISIVLGSLTLNAQVDTLKLVPPLDIGLVLTGNFAEPRSAHFHSGIDFKTYTEGKSLHAVADGYISRINISPWGYGKAIYITHNNGFTSVYGHMSTFTDALKSFVFDLQYQLNSYAIDTLLPEGLFMVKQGEIFGYSGNTGFSAGPHLHFELRETSSEHPVNTLNSVYQLTDNIKPQMSSVVVYVKDIAQNRVYLEKKLTGGAGIYSGGTISVNLLSNEALSFGLEYVDAMNNTSNKFGVKELKMFVNNHLYYQSLIEELDFDKQKQKNSFFDFAYYLNNSRHVHKCFIDPNNDLDFYVADINRGWFLSDSSGIFPVKIEIVDFNGNVSSLNFNIDVSITDLRPEISEYLKWDSNYLLLTKNARMELDSGCMFSNDLIDFSYVGESKFSSKYIASPCDIPLKKPVRVFLLANDKAAKYEDKLFIACVRNKRLHYIDAVEEYGYYCATTRVLGTYYIEADTIPPKITSINLSEGGNMSGTNAINLKISDDLSGISQFNGYINDTWVLFSYEPKTQIVSYSFDEKLPKDEKLKLKFIVSDRVGNTSAFERTFIR